MADKKGELVKACPHCGGALQIQTSFSRTFRVSRKTGIPYRNGSDPKHVSISATCTKCGRSPDCTMYYSKRNGKPTRLMKEEGE